jgi:hypothetical protein
LANLPTARLQDLYFALCGRDLLVQLEALQMLV